MVERENPVVFISYSQDNIAFADKVLAFSNRLRSEGIDAILDQYEEAPSEGWPRWAEKSINNADYVIVVASKGYYDKIYEKVDQGKGRGAKWEGNLIYQKLYMSDSVNRKFIPVVFDEELGEAAGISNSLIAKLGKNENVTVDVLVRICSALDCGIDDIMELIPDDRQAM